MTSALLSVHPRAKDPPGTSRAGETSHTAKGSSSGTYDGFPGMSTPSSRPLMLPGDRIRSRRVGIWRAADEAHALAVTAVSPLLVIAEEEPVVLL